jgi:hypothetical protein
MFMAGLDLAEVLAQGEPGRARCSSAADYERTGLIADLPDCEGQVGPEAREAKAVLLQVQRAVEREDGPEGGPEVRARLEAVLSRMEEALARLRAEGPTAPYQRAARELRARIQLLPDLDSLRSCHAQAQVMVRAPAEADGAPGLSAPVEVKPAQARFQRLEDCLNLLRRVIAQRAIQEALAQVAVEVAPGQRRRLDELLGDVRAAHKLAQNALQVALKEWEVVRARWLRVLFSDRLRVFQQHPYDLPEYDGKARGPLPASVMPRWRYHLDDGRIEVFRFQRHRLISKIIEDPRRS